MTRHIFFSGSVEIPSTYPGIANWPASIDIAEIPTTTYVSPNYVTQKTQEIQVHISVAGGGKLLAQDPPTQDSTTCSKQIASLLE